jgi:hypothetical protein
MTEVVQTNELVVAQVWATATAVARGVRLLGTTPPDQRGWVQFRLDNTDGVAEKVLANWETTLVPAKALVSAYGAVVYAMRTAKKQW